MYVYSQRITEAIKATTDGQTVCQMKSSQYNLLSVYFKDVNFEKAKLQLQMLPDLVKAYKQLQGLSSLK